MVVPAASTMSKRGIGVGNTTRLAPIDGVGSDVKTTDLRLVVSTRIRPSPPVHRPIAFKVPFPVISGATRRIAPPLPPFTATPQLPPPLARTMPGLLMSMRVLEAIRIAPPPPPPPKGLPIKPPPPEPPASGMSKGLPYAAPLFVVEG